MVTYPLVVTPAEREWLVTFVGTPLIGKDLRAYLFAFYLYAKEDMIWGATEPDLWALDSVFFGINPFDVKMSNGLAVETFARKIWAILAEIHGPDLYKERNRARTDAGSYPSANEDSINTGAETKV